MRARGLSPGHWVLALAVVIAAGVLGVVLQASADTNRRAVAEGAMALAPRYLADRPGEAARLALAGNRLEPSVAAELGMLSVAVDSAGIERVVDGGPGRVTAAIRTAHFLVTADEKRVLRVWRPHNGALLGAVRAPDRIVVLADTPAAPLLAAADTTGRLSLIDLSDPHRPKLRRLPVPGGGGPPLALAFSDQAVEIVTVSRDGQVERFDAMTGKALDRWSLREVEGPVPWEGGSGGLRLAAASFDVQAYGAGERILVGLPDGAVVRIELKPKRGRTMIPAGFAPGEITAVSETSYGPGVAAAARGGYVMRESGEVPPTVRRGVAATGIAFDTGDALWIGNREGVGQQPALSYGAELDFAGRPAATLTAGVGGVVAIDPEGAVSLLGDSNSGLGLPDVASSSFAAFDPDGRLLITEGGEYVYRLVALKPGHGREYGQEAPNPELRSYEPDPDWWGEGDGFSVEAGAIDDELAVAGGQDPTGTAVVLAWDAESGRPLRRLPLATGGVETLEPSVVTEVLLLPGKHLVAAYSAVQQLVAIWSTDTWEQVASVPVGAVGSMALHPDESKIVAIGGSDEESEGGTDLVFVDVDAGRAAEVSHPGVTDAAWSSDGNWLAVVDASGALRIMSPDGEDEVRPPIQLEDRPLALAWRPDGEEIAVALGESVVLVDPLTGTISPPLPDPSFATVHHLDWSADGRFLATTASELSEDGEAYEPAPVQLWAVGEARLRRRMCQLAGDPTGPREWAKLVGAGAPQPLCRVPASRPSSDTGDGATGLEEVDLLFRRGNDLFAADLGGNVARVGRAPSEGYPQVSVSWAPDAVAWAAQSEVGMLRLGSRRVSEWTCVCRGAALRGGDLVALASDGRQLFEFSPGRGEPRAIALRGRPGLEPRLIGFLGDRAVVAGFATVRERSTPSTLYLIDSQSRVTRLATDEHGAAHPPFAQSAAGDVLAFTSTVSGGVCYSPMTIGVIALAAGGRPTVAYPPMPGGEEAQVVKSLLIRPDGTAEAAIAPIGCDSEGAASTSSPDATRYVLRDGRWSPTADRGFDVQRAGSAIATISTPQPYEQDGTLSLGTAPDEQQPITGGVEQIWVRP